MNLVPQTRFEYDLDAIVGDHATLDPALTRIEVMLSEIKNGTVTTLTPFTRAELYLAIISGADYELQQPQTRMEMYLYAIAGGEIELPEPITRVEVWLAEWANQGGGTIQTVTGVSPLTLVNALAKPIRSLVQYGKCTQASTPTPSAPVDIVCNNGAIKYGWHDIITTSQLSGYGTYVSPAQAATTRAYRWFKDLPNGTYRLAVDSDYEIIVQWRDPADPADGVAQFYENLSGWMTSGEVTLDKPTGGYGIAVRRTSGTDSITPSNFDGTLHVQERGLYLNGTPEVLTITASGETAQTVSDIPDLYATLDGTVYDEVDLVSGVLTRRTEAVYENGAVVIRALATPVTEQTTPHELRSFAGDTTVAWTAAVSGTEKRVEYAQGETSSNKVGTAKVGTAKAA